MRLGPDVARRREILRRPLLRADGMAFERRCFCSRAMVCNLQVTGELGTLHTRANQNGFCESSFEDWYTDPSRQTIPG